MKLKRIYIPAVIMMVAAASYAGADEVQKVTEKTYRISDGGEVKLTANEGQVSVAGWDNDYIQLKMTKRAWGKTKAEAEANMEDIDVRIQELRDRLIIKERNRSHSTRFSIADLFDGDFWTEKGWHRQQVDYDLKVPRHTELMIISDEGDVEISDIDASVDLSLDEGDADLSGLTADQLKIDLDEGDILLRQSRERENGYWQIQTDEGRIRLRTISVRELDMGSDEGNISLEDAEVEKLWLSVDEGDIYAELGTGPGHDYRLESDEGDIEIVLPADPDVTLKLAAEEGVIESDFHLKIRQHDDGEVSETQLGKGRAYLKAAAEEGDILLLKRKR